MTTAPRLPLPHARAEGARHREAGEGRGEGPAPALRLRGISKRFGSVVANDGISLDVAPGEVLALLGENGAGKSTLVSILFGHYVADAGSIEIDGRTLPPGQPKAALAAGIGMVHQHFTLADNLTVLDNAMLGTEPLWRPFSRRRQARARLVATAARFGLAVDPDAVVGSLSVGEKQRVEIVKALDRGARILILDEPTSVLTPQESEALFATLGRMVAAGLSIVFISHKLAEVLRVSHRVAVLRHGRLVAEAPSASATAGQLAQWMVGRAVPAPERRPAPAPGAVVAALHGVRTPVQRSRAGAEGRDRLDGVSLDLHAGEIVAVAGVSGNGQGALVELLSGLRRPSEGRATLFGGPWPADPRALVAAGVARVPEDRHGTGVVGDLAVWENAVSERLATPVFSRGPFVRRAVARRHAQRLVDAFDVRGAGLAAPARSLSGGNLQKLILGRALLPVAGMTAAPARGTEATPWLRLVVAHQPTWGLDVGAVAAVHGHLRDARDAGAAVLVVSDDLDEVLMLGDRIAVMHAGRLTTALPAAQWTRDAVGLAMAGHVGDSHPDPLPPAGAGDENPLPLAGEGRVRELREAP